MTLFGWKLISELVNFQIFLLCPRNGEEFFPICAGRMWCHCRMVYLPMSYLYGKRFVGPLTPTVLSLRKELYTVPYHEIDWNQARNLCAKVELIFLLLSKVRLLSF